MRFHDPKPPTAREKWLRHVLSLLVAAMAVGNVVNGDRRVIAVVLAVLTVAAAVLPWFSRDNDSRAA